MPDAFVPERLHDASPATKLVYLALDRHAPASMQELATTTTLSESTLSWAIDRLRERNEIKTHTVLGDARRNRYTLQE